MQKCREEAQQDTGGMKKQRYSAQNTAKPEESSTSRGKSEPRFIKEVGALSTKTLREAKTEALKTQRYNLESGGI